MTARAPYEGTESPSPTVGEHSQVPAAAVRGAHSPGCSSSRNLWGHTALAEATGLGAHSPG